MSRAIAKDDILLTFKVGDVPAYFLRVASRHGHETGPRVQQELQQMLDSGVKITVDMKVETPSRFSPEGAA